MSETAASEQLLGYRIYCRDPRELASTICDGLDSSVSRCRWAACINPHSYVLAARDPAFQTALKSANWLIPDGAGIVFASRTLNGTIRARFTGQDLFAEVSAELNRRRPFSALFVGSTMGTLELIGQRYSAEFRNARQIWLHSPPFRESFEPREVAAIADVVEEHKPDLLWIGLSAPKQELLLYAMGQRAAYGFAGAIGAQFDFYAGTIRRSPEFFRRNNLEWLPRLMQEPRRLWKRMFLSAPLFVLDVIKHRISGPASK